jgi:hypothetical protein
MSKSKSLPRLAATVAALILTIAVAGCGRKGDPILATEGPAQPQASSPVGIPVGFSKPSQEAPKPAPKGKFLLDPLL